MKTKSYNQIELFSTPSAPVVELVKKNVLHTYPASR